MFRRILILTATLLTAAWSAAGASDVRIKDIARFQGFSDNQLVGYGLVFGLRGTGDGNQILFTAQAISNMLNAHGIRHERRDIRTRNTASVIVTATLPPFAKPGSKIDIQVAAIGDATSLQGGMLLLTPLRAANGEVYATAQGSLVVGGFSAGGAGTQVVQNVPTSGIVPNGGIVQMEVQTDLQSRRQLTLVLNTYDFTTSSRITEAINKQFASPLARSRDGGVVDVIVPDAFAGNVVDFMALVESITVQADEKAIVVINEKTGTVVIGKDVRISNCAVAHGNLTILVSTTYQVSQPAPFGEGETVVVPQVDLQVTEQTRTGETKDSALMKVPDSTNIDQIVSALNALGVSPRDIISILQAMRAQGALKAEIKVL
jgi:flagellar P-ring protein precursor FlgI